ncbi:two-component system sensor histidine kinase QseC [Roseimicrobium gellanilyticum]|uniref:histidine kinase n=1 Tax=Roseimicrobium gellanilyticum TaxID=748857 RepID=A0A366HTA1_9BACT|nr:HAMP domain-containing sensor histidine kinase [Roseimicrobium gellanilyticum]RBP45927.1 two-component system sensor histidine kinase QseC [Roseimicrobium gellanilyticum]
MATSIRGRLTWMLCLLAAGLLPLAGFVVYYTVRSVLLSQIDDTLAARAQAIIVATEVDRDRLEMDDDLVAFAGFGQGNPRDFFAMYHADGARLLRSSSLPLGSLDFIKQEILEASTQPGYLFGTLRDGRAVRVRVQGFVPAGSVDGGSYHDLRLVTGTEARGLYDTLRTLALVLTGTGLAFFLATIAVLRGSLHHGLLPLEQLAQRIRAIRPGTQDSIHLPHALPDELSPVVEKLNELLKRVDESLARERRFSSHAAHELRTPLAELRASAELAATWSEEATPERLKEMQQSVAELEQLVEKLGTLAKADANAQAVQEPVDIEATIRTAVERYRENADARKITVNTQVQPGAFRTDATLWSTILTNLIGNAIDHSPPGSTVTIRATPARLAVSNPAPHLQVDDVPHLFERFWKKHNSMAARKQHSGLGLSIVESCATAMGANCHASLGNTDGADKTLTIEIEFSEKQDSANAQ